MWARWIAPLRDLEGLLVPLVEHRRSLEVAGAGGGRVDRVVADLDEVLGVAADARAEHARHHLRAEADAEQRLAARQRDALEPVELEAHARPVVVVGALRAAEHHRSGVAREVLGQRVEQVGAAPVEAVAALLQHLADPAGVRVLLVDDDQDGLAHAFRPRLRSLPAVCSEIAHICKFPINSAGRPGPLTAGRWLS